VVESSRVEHMASAGISRLTNRIKMHTHTVALHSGVHNSSLIVGGKPTHACNFGDGMDRCGHQPRAKYGREGIWYLLLINVRVQDPGHQRPERDAAQGVELEFQFSLFVSTLGCIVWHTFGRSRRGDNWCMRKVFQCGQATGTRIWFATNYSR
jgi:hypothetical protein